ncbi:glycosyltransferase [Brevibacillus fluminis]|uniref:N-acetylglucosaminyldiphosphoundecaprenol N-acetyl-beta-D-mannosaminyltransferase n=1 Tax=Brevibacillus fluminis TaxID=511487 RepID=A0A3M8D3P8_9BACL|nr:WecB/TagA/CpsF family glycosyltransferase [Brevibacillus fluminis]RNB82077.1 glycosyltransferase [Brevibacillus fluminis]
MKEAKILGVSFSTLGFNATVSDLVARAEAGQRTHVVTANPEVVMIAKENAGFQSILDQAYVVPDGIGIVYAAKMLDKPLHERVTGVELVDALMQEANTQGWKVFLLGASPDVNRMAAARLEKDFPGAKIVGRRDGYFSADEEQLLINEINAASPDLLFVAMGVPRQEFWIAKHWSQLNTPIVIGIGGVFDVLAGTVKRAPVLWQKLHLEWLYRLLRQPSRWKRQLAIPRFVGAVLIEKWGKR